MNLSFNLIKKYPRIVGPNFSSVIFSKQYSQDQIIDPPDSSNLVLPKSKKRENESITNKYARLIYQSRKRGMLENDLLLSTFAAKYLKKLSEKELQDYDNLINNVTNDWDIYYWATSLRPIPEEYKNRVMELLVEHCKNLNKESRIKQPDL